MRRTGRQQRSYGAPQPALSRKQPFAVTEWRATRRCFRTYAVMPALSARNTRANTQTQVSAPRATRDVLVANLEFDAGAQPDV
jgi:hypothetical protein